MTQNGPTMRSRLSTVMPGNSELESLLLVTRVAGLPADALDDLAAPRTTSALHAAIQHEESAKALVDSVSADLYALVPKANTQEIRRAAIALRRDVHNFRWSRRAGAALSLVAPAMGDAAAARLEAWAQSMRASDRWMAISRESLPGEVAHATEAMTRRLRAPNIAAGLALASPDFTRRLLDEDIPAELEPRFARSAVSYLTRTAAKTSPFSYLGVVGTTEIRRKPASEGSKNRFSNLAFESAVSTNRALAVALLRTCARQFPADPVVDVVVNPELALVDDRWLAVLPAYAVRDGLCIRHDQIVDCSRYAKMFGILLATPISLTGFAGEPESYEAVASLLARLVEGGLLQPVVPWPATTRRPFAALSQLVRERAGGKLVGFQNALQSLAAREELIATSHSPRMLLTAIAEARSSVHDAFQRLGTPVPDWVASAPIFHETVSGGASIIEGLPAVVGQDLRAVSRALAADTVLTARYHHLVRCFVSRYGTGGAGNLLEFSHAYLDRVDINTPMRSARNSRTTPGDLNRPRDNPTVGAPSHTMFFQLAANSISDIDAARYELIVNLIQPGSLGLVTRWGGLSRMAEKLSPWRSSWLNSKHPGARVYQFSAYSDWVDIQGFTLDGVPRLRCPGDLPGRDPEEVGFSDITLYHDPASETLRAVGPGGHPAAFNYVGTVPVHLIAGPARLLCLLSDPWMMNDGYYESRQLPGSTIVFQPRRQEGRVVFRRAQWVIPQNLIPRPGRDAVRFLADMERWRLKHDMPVEVYITQVLPGVLGSVPSKPQWMSFTHPHSLYTAVRQIESDALSVKMHEALPVREQYWVVDDRGRRYASEFTCSILVD